MSGIPGMYPALAILACTLLLMGSITGCSKQKKMAFGTSEVYYSNNVTEAEAKKLGDYLTKIKFFERSGKRVDLDKDSGAYKMRVALTDTAMARDEAFRIVLKNTDLEISKNVFNDEKVAIDLTDNDMNTIWSMAPVNYGKRMGFKGIDIYYAPPIQAAETEKLGKFLTEKGTFGDSSTINLQKKDGRYAFRFMVKPGMERDTNFIRQCGMFGRTLSQSVFGNAPVDVYLCDRSFRSMVVVKSDTQPKKSDSTAAPKTAAPKKPNT